MRKCVEPLCFCPLSHRQDSEPVAHPSTHRGCLELSFFESASFWSKYASPLTNFITPGGDRVALAACPTLLSQCLPWQILRCSMQQTDCEVFISLDRTAPLLMRVLSFVLGAHSAMSRWWSRPGLPRCSLRPPTPTSTWAPAPAATLSSEVTHPFSSGHPVTGLDLAIL